MTGLLSSANSTLLAQALAMRAEARLVAVQETPEPVGCQALGVVVFAGPAPLHRAMHRCLRPAPQPVNGVITAASHGNPPGS